MEGLKARIWIAAIVVALATAFILPNFVDTSKISWWPAKKLNYGLDIQGGVQLVMGADVAAVIATTVERQTRSLQTELDKEGVKIQGFDNKKASQGAFDIIVSSVEDAKKVESYIGKQYPGSLQILSSNSGKVEVKYYDAYLIEQKQNVIRQSIETIRNRIDEFGVAEPSISQQGEDRVMVQLPGVADAEHAKQLINTTAKLDFMIVSYEKSEAEVMQMIEEAEKAGNYSIATMKYNDYVTQLNEDLKNKLPESTVVYFEKIEGAANMEAGNRPYLLETTTDLTGDALDNAMVSFDQYGNPEVALRFNSIGAARFADITDKNVNRQMAVVLDKVVKTAPNINQKITGGSAVITLGRGGDRNRIMEEAKIIATSLRAGSLPVSLEQLEERRVGPTLGMDALAKARMAALVSAIIVMVFMAIYYKGMGIISNIALLLNLAGIFAILGSLGATLTLPGIAGMALTIGFAVDASVLINERIREELAKGVTMQTAVQEGYNKAMTAILDANAISAGTAIVLLYFGTGPVKGFAVTLLAGITMTIVSSVFLSKVIVDTLMYKFNVQKISV